MKNSVFLGINTVRSDGGRIMMPVIACLFAYLSEYDLIAFSF